MPRFRIRTLMVAVAVVALLMGAVAWFNVEPQDDAMVIGLGGVRAQAEGLTRDAETNASRRPTLAPRPPAPPEPQ